jgi:hypothetical protein
VIYQAVDHVAVADERLLQQFKVGEPPVLPSGVVVTALVTPIETKQPEKGLTLAEEASDAQLRG